MPEARQFVANETKFRELVLYVAGKLADDPRFGSTKLNKILFAADFLAYGVLGKPITGVEYVKRQFGPVPRLFPVYRDNMQQAGELTFEERPYGSWTQRRAVPLREADLDLFTAREIAIVDNALSSFYKANATQISEWSHGLCGWAVAEEDATIPYEAVFISDRKMTAYEAERGRQLALERGWDVF